jgi:hypothetical protein
MVRDVWAGIRNCTAEGRQILLLSLLAGMELMNRGRPRIFATPAEKQKAYRQRQKNVTKFEDAQKRNGGKIDPLAIVRILRDGCVELKDSPRNMSNDYFFSFRTEDFPYNSVLKGWLELETEKRKWQNHLKQHIQGLLDPLEIEYHVFPAGWPHESGLVIWIQRKPFPVSNHYKKEII